MLRRQPCRCAFEDLAHRVEFENLGHGQAAHHQTARAGGLDEAFRSQTAEGFAHRRAADVQTLRHFFFA